MIVKVPPCISSILSAPSRARRAEIGDRLLDLGQRLVIAVAHHRHDQPALGADRDADVIVVLVDDVGAVDLGVDGGNLLQRLHAGPHEEAHEAELDAVLLLEQLLVFGCAVAITALMSTSLKVVSMAAVFCASFRRRAMVWRSRVICTRSSRAASSGADGARTGTRRQATGVGATRPFDRRQHVALGDAAVLAGAGDGRRRRSRFSAAILRTDGDGGQPRPVFGRARGLRRHAAAAALRHAASIGCGRRGLLVGPAGRHRRRLSARPPRRRDLAKQRADRDGLAVLGARSRPSTPAAGAGTSMVTLSVSSSTSGSSTATGSPGFLNHLPMVASVTDSPSVGTRISVVIASCTLSVAQFVCIRA